MSFKKFVQELSGNRVEGELLKTVFYSLISSFIVLGLLYYVKFKTIENFIPKYGLYLFLAILSYSLIIPTIRQVRAYKKMACMSGMMIGMTIGMMAGFLAGYFVGATNGMFIGGLFGMGVGIVLGIWTGSCCGIMGLMEGLMAGFMGGWMGSMTAVMLVNDNLKLASWIIFAVCSVILISLNYMIYTETKESERELKEDHFITIAISIVLTLLTSWIIIYGPRSALFS
jgi:hypothetical protein